MMLAGQRAVFFLSRIRFLPVLPLALVRVSAEL